MAITPLMPVYPRSPVRPVRGEGVYLFGEQGERYLDFAAGIAVNILGHGHPYFTKAIQDQAASLMHVSNLYGSPQGEAFAQRLIDLTFADTVFFTNSGVEAVECAIKTARREIPHLRPDVGDARLHAAGNRRRRIAVAISVGARRIGRVELRRGGRRKAKRGCSAGKAQSKFTHACSPCC
jgi:hypothetical protein